ncbi:hypothetical protein CKAN_00138000 [Cinnamomum micranthum f. kanehirae]|uniref:Uncharacterized protein n=1 Tax=Cinnamomum micranthum f. kanehirae TaxID=337451 RepID=A0A3S3PT98_9MAGN|nr:hypothetical protein CKAN_00138000 [Cinnamomum micranthum f. kanehirae]
MLKGSIQKHIPSTNRMCEGTTVGRRVMKRMLEGTTTSVPGRRRLGLPSPAGSRVFNSSDESSKAYINITIMFDWI